jgi:hypothetical protein
MHPTSKFKYLILNRFSQNLFFFFLIVPKSLNLDFSASPHFLRWKTRPNIRADGRTHQTHIKVLLWPLYALENFKLISTNWFRKRIFIHSFHTKKIASYIKRFSSLLDLLSKLGVVNEGMTLILEIWCFRFPRLVR